MSTITASQMSAIYSNVTATAIFLAVAILATLLSLAVLQLRTAAKIRTFKDLHGCKEATSKYPGRPYLFGLDYVLSFIPHIRKHRFAEYSGELFDQLGPTFLATVAGKPVIHTIDPENLKALLATQNIDYNVIPAREQLAKTIYGNGIFATNGHEWKKSHDLVRQVLKNMDYSDAAFDRHAELMLGDIRETLGRPSNFVDKAWRFTSDLVFNLYFGESTRSQDQARRARSSRLAAGFARLGQIGRSVTLFGRRIPYVIDFVYHGWRREKQAVESILDTHLQQARDRMQNDNKHNLGQYGDESVSKKTLVEALAGTTEDLTRAKAEIMNLMLAGGDTVAIGLNEMVWLLSRHPKVWQKLRAEIKLAFQGEKPELSALKKLEYLKCIINESLRIRPTLSVHGRFAMRDTVLPRGGGPDGLSPIHIPKGAYVLYSNYSLNRQSHVFGNDVDTFRPERWWGQKEPMACLASESSPLETGDGSVMAPTARLKVNRYEFLSFGGGARACPGEKLGFLMCAYALTRLAQEFEELKAADDRPWEEATAFSYFNRHGVHVTFVDASTDKEL